MSVSANTGTLRAIGPPGRTAQLAIAVVLGLLLAGCDAVAPNEPGSGEKSAAASVTSTSGALATITVSPNPDTVFFNQTQQFTAVGRDAGGNVVAISPTWDVGDAGTITGTGLFTAGTMPGNWLNGIAARSGEISGYATIKVKKGPDDQPPPNEPPPPPPVVLGQASGFGILAGTTVTCVTGGLVSADVGVWPGSAVTGFPPCLLTGTQHLGDAVAQTAQGNLTTAYNQLAGMACSPANALTGQDLGGKTLAPGVYCFTSSAFLTGTLTLAGPASATWVFQIASTLITGTNSAVVLSGGASAQNVYWQVGSSATIAVGTVMQGSILALTSISLQDNASLLGRALARNGAVTLGSNNTITLPGGTVPPGTVGKLSSITVSPNPDTVFFNQTQQFTAVGRDANGNVVPISPTWDVGDAGTITNTGFFTAGTRSGNWLNGIAARSGDISGYATIKVKPDPNNPPPPNEPPPPPPVVLGQANGFGILAGTTVTCVTGGLVSADVGVWPGSAVTGFPPCLLTGTQHLGDAVAQTAQGNLTTAYNQLAGMACSPANALTGQDLGGKTLAPGVYCFTSSAFLNGTLTLAGPANGTWVFQIASTLITGTNSAVVLSGGASAQNVYWQVGSSATVAVGTVMQGSILALTSISLQDNATLLGRALARNGAVTLGTNNTVTLP